MFYSLADISNFVWIHYENGGPVYRLVNLYFSFKCLYLFLYFLTYVLHFLSITSKLLPVANARKLQIFLILSVDLELVYKYVFGD